MSLFLSYIRSELEPDKLLDVNSYMYFGSNYIFVSLSSAYIDDTK